MSNLACRFITRGTNKKCKIRSKGITKGSRDLLLIFLDPLHISGTVRAGNATFCTQVINRGTNDRNAKLGQKGQEGVT